MFHNSIAQTGQDPLDLPQIRRANIQPLIAALANDKRAAVEEIGRSYLDTPINAITLGHGEIKILAWTQMHGDEPTATASVFDLISLLLSDSGPVDFDSFADAFTLKVIPMLNPDGAEQETRVNAQAIDINRDALALNTPEGRVLMDMAKAFQPHIGFNLHDQSPFYSAGETSNHATMAFLAPAFDPQKSIDDVRQRAMQLIVLMSHAISAHIPGLIARYDDAFAPHCFGDSLAGLGISTILIESGEHPDDPNRQIARKLNVVSMCTAIQALLDESYRGVTVNDYFALPENKKEGLITQRRRHPTRACTPVSNAEKPGWLERHHLKQTEAAALTDNVQWALIGDSIIQGFEENGKAAWDKHLAPLGAFNLGFNGDRTEHTLWRVANGALDGLSLKGVVLLIGTNNTVHLFDNPEDTATAIAELAHAIHLKQPEAKVVIHAILPAGRQQDDKKRQRNHQINRMIRWLRQRPYIDWLDLSHLFVDETGAIPEVVMGDALHPTAHQYTIWGEALASALKRMAQH